MSLGDSATATRDIVVDEVLPHAPEVVWRLLTTPELIGRWFMAPTGFAAVEGTRFTYQTTPAGAWDGVIRCEVLEVRPARRLVYSWTGGDEANLDYGSRLDTTVAWTLTPEGEGTRLRLVHAGFVSPRNDHTYRNLHDGWPKVLAGIGKVASE
jgi:uncharacterized protein YndB with AHSA1/START domain